MPELGVDVPFDTELPCCAIGGGAPCAPWSAASSCPSTGSALTTGAINSRTMHTAIGFSMNQFVILIILSESIAPSCLGMATIMLQAAFSET
jgi:hypothetical protein